MNVAFAPLHNHSEFSALDGLSTVHEIGRRAQAIGCSCCGITDHGTCAGHLEAAKVLPQYGVKPIFGSELYHGLVPGKPPAINRKAVRDQAHLVALAQNDEGLRNLWRLIDFGTQNFHFVGRVTWDILRQYNEGLIVTSACIQGLISQGLCGDQVDPYEALNNYLDIFGDRFYIELHTYNSPRQREVNIELVRIAQERGLPLVYATDAHYAFKEQYPYHDAYVLMQTGRGKSETVETPPEERSMWHPQCLYMMDVTEIRQALDYLPVPIIDEALANSGLIADQCHASLPDIRRHLPSFVPKSSPWVAKQDQAKNAKLLFIDLVEAGIYRRYGNNPNPQVLARAEREMEVFLGVGLEHYFLQAWDFCQFCDAENIRRGPGRGSAAGSLVSYCLGITDVDPLRYNLIFERFYNPGREKGFPDIDNDFPVASRKLLHEYMQKRWGKERVRSIGTTTRLKPKTLCDRTYSIFGISFAEKEELKKIIDRVPDIDILGPESIGWSESIDPGKTIYVETSVGDQIGEWVAADRTRVEMRRQWVEHIKVLCGRVSGYGIHPSGVVVSDVDLNDELPCEMRGGGKEKTAVTIFPMADVDHRQFVKQDFLGLRNIDTLQQWEQLVEQRIGPINWTNFWSGLEGQSHPEDMWKLLEQGFTRGIFQIEEGPGKLLCKSFKPRSVEDLCAIVTLIRPGPARAGAPKSFVARRRGQEDDAFDGRKIPILKNILDDTYGWFLYQEQVIQYFSKLGYSLADADAVRKILGKKKPEEMKALYEGAGEWLGKGYKDVAWPQLSADTAEIIWSKLEDFAKYSFNKSHSLAYATIGFRTLFCKYYAPAEFVIASISTIGDDPDRDKKTAGYISEGRRLGIKVQGPDIMRSQVEICAVDGDIIFGFSNIKHIGKGTAQYLVDLRDKYGPFYSHQALTAAIEEETARYEERKHQAARDGRKFVERSPRQRINAKHEEHLFDAGAFDNYTPRQLTLRERQSFEKEYLGVVLTDQTQEIVERNLHEIAECNELHDIADLSVGDYVQVPLIIANIEQMKARKNGAIFGKIAGEWDGEEVQFVAWNKEWQNYRFLWQERTVALVWLRKRENDQLVFSSGIKLS